jgi:hypothetical protein
MYTAILGEKRVRFFSHIRSFRMTLRNFFSVISNEVRNLDAFQIHRELLLRILYMRSTDFYENGVTPLENPTIYGGDDKNK